MATRDVEIIMQASASGWRIGLFQDRGTEFQEFEVPPNIDTRGLVHGIIQQFPGHLWLLEEDEPNRIHIQGVRVDGLLVCDACKGTGKYVGFLTVEDCDPCLGTGYDLRGQNARQIFKPEAE